MVRLWVVIMLKVKNRKCINNIARKSFKANKIRNSVAIIAITLTALLFTSLFTVGTILVTSFEYQNFRQVGGDTHGTFKQPTKEQIEKLKNHPLVEDYTLRRALGFSFDTPFEKNPIEISYMNEKHVKSSFINLKEGNLPKENTNEFACDTKVLELLGVTPQIGQEITITYALHNGKEEAKITDTFVLSGYWDYDEIAPARHILVANSYIDEVIERENFVPVFTHYIHTGSYEMGVYLKNSNNIEGKLDQILTESGYQREDASRDGYMRIGVNWGYANAQANANMDPTTMLFLVLLIIIFILTGYLIIYNIFQISVVNDIKFYGLLKTIGTTKRQIKRLVVRQAIFLSITGIPIGLILGYLMGYLVAPLVMSTLNYVGNLEYSVNPLIFIGGAAFSLVTVFISCIKPAKFAGKVTPIEAIRYTETSINKKDKKGNKTNLFKMAIANMGRSKRKITVVVGSLSLAVVILHLTATFTGGFDIDKYLRAFSVSDFVLGHNKYLTTQEYFNKDIALTEGVITDVTSQISVTEGGRVYGVTKPTSMWIPFETYKADVDEEVKRGYMSQETAELRAGKEERNQNGEVLQYAYVYGLEQFPLEQLTLIEGSFEEIYKGNPNAIIALYNDDDYGKPIVGTNPKNVGENVTLRYVDKFEYYHLMTDEVIDGEEVENGKPYYAKTAEYTEKTYEVVATATMEHPMTIRYGTENGFVLNAQVMKEDSGTDSVINYMFNTKSADMEYTESFLNDYTTQIDSNLNYESRIKSIKEFNNFKSMFVAVGAFLSFVIGFIGILNFFNAILTSIITRRQELAMLQSIGMTGKQLKKMLILEGLCYVGLTIIVTTLLIFITAPMLEPVLSGIFWFFTYHFTILPLIMASCIFMVLAIIIPLLVYKSISRQTIVERLREFE